MADAFPLVTPLDLWTVAQTVYGEARGESWQGQLAVAHVIRNRQELHPRWRGQSLTAICRAPQQFSCWNADDPNLPLLVDVSLTDAAFRSCLSAAIEVLGGTEATVPLYGATHFHATTLKKKPAWALRKQPVVVIGHHAFYANIP